MTGCGVVDCLRPVHAHGFCGMHAARLRRTGSPTGVRRETTLGSFWKRVEVTGFCWLWRGYVLKSGYGQIASRVRPTPSGTRLAHRVAYELLVGPIEEGLDLDHLCRVRTCVNPDHLEPVTPKTNAERGLHGRLRTHCAEGHELTRDNTALLRDGSRRCRTCARAWDLASKQRSRERAAVRQAYATGGGAG